MSLLAPTTRRLPPEIPLVVFGFVFHFLWEAVQCPLLYVGMAESSHGDGVVMCLRATVGDVNILLAAFWGTALASRRGRRWIVEPRPWEHAAFLGIGLAATVTYELLATRVWDRWAYSDAMPLLFGVGLTPVAQWLVIPPIVLWLACQRVPTAALLVPGFAALSIRQAHATEGRPANLDELVELALSRDPAALGSALDAEAARARSAGARQPMSPQLMIGADSLGVPMDDPDPTMWMGGVSQMLPGWGQLRAQSRRYAVEADRFAADRERIAADLRLRLWQSAARIHALQQEIALLDEQLGESEAIRQVAFARYRSLPVYSPGSGATSGGAMPAESMESTSSVSPPRVEASRSPSVGMSGMGGAGGTAMTSRAPVAGMESGMESARGGAMQGSSPMGSEGALPGVLRLDVTVERLRAERGSLEARLLGEMTVLALFVGDAARAVAATPSRFRGTPPPLIPERKLAELDRVAASADLALAQARRRPDLMWSIAGRAMPPHGEFAVVNASVGIVIPVWGGLGREVAASRRGLAAAEARKAAVERDLAAAATAARASLEAARLRTKALESAVLPRALTSYAVSRKVYASGRGSIDDALLAWDALISVKRERVIAHRDEELRAAELARVEDR